METVLLNICGTKIEKMKHFNKWLKRVPRKLDDFVFRLETMIDEIVALDEDVLVKKIDVANTKVLELERAIAEVQELMKLKIKEEDNLHTWCLEQAAARYKGTLSEEQFEKLQEIKFPWAHYEEELDKMGFYWEANNPNGKRWTE